VQRARVDGLGCARLTQPSGTSRGHPAEEIVTIMKALNLSTCLFAPAYPANGARRTRLPLIFIIRVRAGRITVGGYQLLHGLPVTRSAMAGDDRAPAK
jgi:uncharacterized protein YgbK (DUF1537 family)